jgi:hypothetical protein
MKQSKPFLFMGAVAAAITAAVMLPSPTSGQAPGDDQVLAQLVAEVNAQQAKIVANQLAMDEKIATIAENVRLARLFAARGGGTK